MLMSTGAISEPAPMPVAPTSTPTRSPARISSSPVTIPSQIQHLPDKSKRPCGEYKPCANGNQTPFAQGDSLGGAVRLDQHAGHLGPAELGRRLDALPEHLADLRARQVDVILRRVRTRLGRAHVPARLAEERVVEEHRLDPELVALEAVEDQVRVVRAVVAAHAGVVAAHDEVRAAVVLAADRVPDGLTRPRVAH